MAKDMPTATAVALAVGLTATEMAEARTSESILAVSVAETVRLAPLRTELSESRALLPPAIVLMARAPAPLTAIAAPTPAATPTAAALALEEIAPVRSARTVISRVLLSSAPTERLLPAARMALFSARTKLREMTTPMEMPEFPPDSPRPTATEVA